MTTTPVRRGNGHNSRVAAVCAQADPELWAVDAGRYDERAIAICASCPVRIPCRDEHLAHRSVGVIGGGWVFFTGTGTGPRPFPGDDPKLANGRPVCARKAIDPVVGANFIAAGRAYLASNTDPGGLIARFGLSLTSIRQAASIVRFSPRATVDAVARGEMAIQAAITELRMSGAARQSSRRAVAS